MSHGLSVFSHSAAGESSLAGRRCGMIERVSTFTLIIC